MKILQELGLALALLFVLIGIPAYKYEYKKTSVVFFILATICLLLFVIGFFYIF